MTQQQLHWPVDGHVHFHQVSRVAPTLDAAVANFSAVSDRRDGLLGAVLLTQHATERVFESLLAARTAGGWTFGAAGDEPETLIARQGQVAVVVVCGRQVRAADGLEVLALGTRSTFPDGLSFLETVSAVRQSGALAVIPWGFGKWLGRRGKRVEAALELSMGVEALFVGDNGSRLSLLGAPTLVRAAEQRGFRVLPGTDPFPFGGDHRRVGRFGFLADVDPAEAAPWRSLRAWLVEQPSSPVPYGRACGLGRFLVIQVGIQIYNRFRPSPNG